MFSTGHHVDKISTHCQYLSLLFSTASNNPTTLITILKYMYALLTTAKVNKQNQPRRRRERLEQLRQLKQGHRWK